ncbi:MAG: hypothetical protein GX437_10605 [Sphingobacteriales bacterium]|nr:hypothetical protein [Sphingobacteriales bacterium]
MKNIQKIIIIAVVAMTGLLIAGCEKNMDDHVVTYVIKGLSSDFQVAYFNENEHTVKIDSMVISDKAKGWTYSFKGKPGALTYLYVRYKDDVDMMSGFWVAILVDGRAIEQAYNYDMADTTRKYPYQIIRQGFIPF